MDSIRFCVLARYPVRSLLPGLWGVQRPLISSVLVWMNAARLGVINNEFEYIWDKMRSEQRSQDRTRQQQ
jgi:hypothetical protein